MRASPWPSPIQANRKHPNRTGRGPRDRDVGLFAAFTVGTLLMVVGITGVGFVDTRWVLAPVLLVDFAVTFAVLRGIARLLSDDGDHRRQPFTQRCW